MDFSSSAASTWLAILHLTVLVSTHTIDILPGGDALWKTQIRERKTTTVAKHQLVDVASPRRTGHATSPPSTTSPFLTFAGRGSDRDEMHYNLTAFDVEHHFILRPERRFIAPSFKVEHFSGNESISVPCGSDLSHCYYRGSVRGDPVSSAVFDLCNGMRGAFKTRSGVYLVQPLVQNRTPGLDETDVGSDGKQHLIINHLAMSASSPGQNGSHCGVEDKMLINRTKTTKDSPSQFHALPKMANGIHSRAKRETIFQGAQSYPRYVELMFTADKSMLDHYGSEFEIKRYLQTIMAVVHDIFLNPKIGNSIEVVLTGIKILTNDEDLKITNDATKSLHSFCAWQYKQNVASDSDPGHYDTAVLITRKNICRISGQCETLGLAELGTMCDPERSCSIVEDNGLGVAFTVAHELGHVFNIGHDATSKQCLGERDGLRLMAPSLNLQATPWSWSSCSRQEITEFLDQGHDKCLMDKPQYQYKKSTKLPGEVYNPSMQCKLTYGKDSTLCRIKTNTRSCRQLWCRITLPYGYEGCRTHDMPWAEGSPCGDGKWCIHGNCVRKQIHSKVNGRWSVWSPFGPCSRTCGGGVTYSSRHCNNPSPSHGGRFCLGAKKRFKSCHTQSCPKGTPNFREVQCAAFNGKREPKGSKWIPRYVRGRYKCQLICERVGGGDFATAKVIDGTKCDEKKFDVCVNGICRLAGCDNVLNSRAALDVCGVCGGDSTTCERISKTWHQRVLWGNNDVAVFHPGYSSIRIEQTTPEFENKWRRTNKRGDDNYLVLLNERRRSILNGQYSIRSETEVTFSAIGLEITYSGSQSDPEYIKIEGKLKNKLYLQVLSVEKVLAPKITYSYIRPKKDLQRFVWDTKGAWSRCSRECQGLKMRKLICKRERDGLVVSVQRCNQKKMPASPKENCNTYCLSKWVTTDKGACQPACGPGTQKIYLGCVKHDTRSGKDVVRSDKYCRHVTKPRDEQPCNGKCDNVQWVYTKWSDCSKSCGSGLQRRKVTCVEKIAYAQKVLPPSTCSRIEKRSLQRACNTVRCPSWRTGKWSHCSQVCGEGHQRRKVACVRRGKEGTCDPRKKPKEKQDCRMKACPHWEYDGWSDCPVTCGAGHQIRLVRCVDADRSALKDDECRTVQKPTSRRLCQDLPLCDKTVFLVTSTHKKPAGGEVEWITGDWGECSARCGTGHQGRQLRCVNTKGQVLLIANCANVTKPATVQSCIKYCGHWRYSDWTPCSSGCGKGTQRRQVKCFSGYHLTDDQMCDPLLRPPNIRQCSNYFCSPAKQIKPKTSGRWKTGSWSECSRTCENGIKRRSVICMDGFSKRDLTEKSCKTIPKPATVTSCDQGLCPQWKTKQWSRCSKSCDLGTVTREVHCSDNMSTVKDEQCNRKLKPAAKKTCFVKRCVVASRWVKGVWNACSAKCGEGVKERKVWCEDLKGKRISPMQCKRLRRKPKSMKKCRRNNCGIWESGPWGECSSKCNIGEKVRHVRCRKDSSFVDDEFCSNKDKVLDKKPCLVADCKPGRGQYKWFTTDWAPCTTTCGVGVKSRMILCVDEKEVQTEKHNCNPDTIPSKTMTCKNKQCFSEWDVGYWSECSASCGQGNQTRSVTCPKKKKQSTDLCDQKRKPASERKCNLGLCNGYYTWRTGSWSRCSATCGEATMRRAVKCLGRKRGYSLDMWCSMVGVAKPESHRKCKLPQCLPKTCKDIQTQSGKQHDKEFSLTINNKKIKVFCQGMLTDNPKEYITLPSGAKHNFAEYYHRSLKNPNECPYNGARSDHCPHCHTKVFPSSGGSYFSKVRFDVARMSLIGNDFTFAVRRGEHFRAFGTAGDCYSKTSCPQGRFSIDLTNTGLSLARDVTWRSYGYHISRVVNIKETRQIVTGMCGGYCGVCRPYRSLRVTV